MRVTETDFYNLPFHKLNEDLVHETPVMPVPEYKKDLPYKFNFPGDVTDEPKFDPKVHLALEYPAHLTRLPDFKKVKTMKGQQPGSLAYSQPVRLISDEGVRILRSIIKRERPNELVPTRGSRTSLRGLYYRSPFIRDLQSHPKVLELLSAMAGEQLVPSHFNNSTPQVNISIPGMGGAAEFWHWDSVSYVANFLLNDPEGMEGGDFEIIKLQKKTGMEALCAGTLAKDKVEKLVYGPPGTMVLAQGSEILHHVTPIKSKQERIVMILCFCPANVFKPDKMVLCVEEQEDSSHGNTEIAAYEFFRGKAWVCGQALTGMASKVPHTENRQKLADRLRSVSHELERVADILDGTNVDTIGYFDETTKSHRVNYPHSKKK